MTFAMLVLLALKLSIMLIVLALGMGSTQRDALYLLTRPRLFFRSMLAMNLVMPLVAAALAAGFNLNPAVKLALVALSVSPVPPLFPRTAIKAGGDTAYPVGLLVAAALLAVAFVPLAIDVLGNAFGKAVHVPVMAVVKVVLTAVLAPLAVGILLRRRMPEFSHRMSKPVSVIGNILLLVAIVPVLFTTGKAMWSLVGNGTLAAFAVFIIAGLATGHLLGGPDQKQRPVLALATAMRHPGVAIAISSTTFPQLKPVIPAILLYLLVAAFLTAVYLSWLRRTRKASQEEQLRAA